MAIEDGLDATVLSASTTSDEGGTSSDQHHFLLVFEAAASFMHPLATSGEVEIGRYPAEGGLKLDDSSVSRRHAKILIDGSTGDVTLVDLGSQNGTRINGERVAGSRRLASADMITIGGATLVYHADRRADVTSRVLEFAELRRRLEEEIERVLRFKRAFGMLCVSLRAPSERTTLDELFHQLLRKLDVYAWVGPEEVVILLPETGAQTEQAAQRLHEGLRKVVGTEVRVGYTMCPDDGCEADALIANLRTAALAATRDVAPAQRSMRTIEIAGRNVVIGDAAMIRLYAMIERLASADLPVLFTGETGSGKEIAATAIHTRSPRHKRPLVTLNCAAIQETLVESELFGYERGAFSGAVNAKQGLFEVATGGTVFLDEIGELSASTQAKLLRALETKRITRLGDIREREIDIRLVAATNRDLLDEVEAGRFRRDLYFRLSGAVLSIPPLRERVVELPVLAETFLAEACTRLGRTPMTISPTVVAILRAHHWPGNLRELKNLMDYVAAAFVDPVVEPSHLADRLRPKRITQPVATPVRRDREPTPAPAFAATPGAPRSLANEIAELERRRIVEALAAHRGNHSHAAKSIGMPLRTFFTKVKKYKLGET